MTERSKSKRGNLSSAERWGLSVAIITLVISSVLSTYSVWQNSQNINMSRATLEMSLEPTIDVSLPDNYGQTISVRNTGSVPINDVRVFPICYIIKKENESFKIVYRHPLASLALPVQMLNHQQHSEISLKDASCSQLPEVAGNYLNALVIVFHRQQDSKKFIKVEPFIMSNSEPEPGWASSIYVEGWSGDPSIILGLAEKINATEGVIFRVDK